MQSSRTRAAWAPRGRVYRFKITRFISHHSLFSTHYATTNSRDKGAQNDNPINNLDDPVFTSGENTVNLGDSCNLRKTQKPNLAEFVEDVNIRSLRRSGILSSMSWVGFKAALGQRINLEGIASSVGIIAKDKHLAIPNVAVPDIRFIDWAELKMRGFQGVVFDKDNTLTIPYNLRLWAPLGESLEQCRSLFGNNVLGISCGVVGHWW